jgi:antibiotic biosynthesis monooxygenase (ABM) superfamily enzyme
VVAFEFVGDEVTSRLSALRLPLVLNLFIVSALIVTCLTWLIMPRLARWFKPWLNPLPQKKDINKPQ